MINGENFFDQPVKNDLRPHDNIQKIIMSVQGDDYATGFPLYLYFKEYCKMIAIYLNKQQEVYADPKAIEKK